MLIAGAMSVAASAPRYVKMVEFPPEATPEQKVDMAARLVPAQNQLDWQNLEMTAFLHFGINTFTDREWGDGTEDPAIFNPVDLDADQWVRTLKDAGFGLVILTAKHHDGFCLWPTATTAHSVASSPWKGGKGDVMAELRRACDKYGMKLGVYLSPWDRNAPCYGDSPAYNDMYVAQLTELLTNYGKIDEVWLDGANGEGPNGKQQVYDWMRYRDVITRLQPDAVMAIKGDDVRWVGNERGMGRSTEWSATALTPGIYPAAGADNAAAGVYSKAPDLGGRDVVAKAKKLYWWPSEVDVSIRNGWFYHDKEQPKPLRHLAEIYLNSVGRNSVLLLNIPPDRRGLIPEADVARLAELKQWIDASFTQNLATPCGELEVEIRPDACVNTVVLSEDISKGQHVESFTVEGLINGSWMPLVEGTTIGNKRILSFEDVRPSRLRLVIHSCRNEPNISRFEAYSTSLPATVNVDIPGYRAVPPTDWSVSAASTPVGEAYHVFDDSQASAWICPSDGEQFLTVDMKRTIPVAGFRYLPAAVSDSIGQVQRYRLELSSDSVLWTVAPTPEEFTSLTSAQSVYFPAAINARYFRFTVLGSTEGKSHTTVAELEMLRPEGEPLPKDNERQLWNNAAAQLRLKPGQPHQKVKGWNFLTSWEFNSPEGTPNGVPAGWQLHPGAHVSRNARVDADNFVNRPGYLRLESRLLPDTVDNGHGVPVKHSTYAARTVGPADSSFVAQFTENMRVEVRARRSSHTGLNDALWFMGNTRKPWPDKGEIDMMENPKATVNNTAHFTLHSKNMAAHKMGGSGSISAKIDLQDMTDWNIYWIEWLPDEIRGGVNGQTYFVHHKEEGMDWPWSDPEQFHMLLSSCLSTNPDAWPGAVDSETWDPYNPPHFDIDWIRIFTK